MDAITWTEPRGTDGFYPQALGRNGVMSTAGVLVTALTDSILLEPVTTRKLIGRCSIEIPSKDVGQVARAMLAKVGKDTADWHRVFGRAVEIAEQLESGEIATTSSSVKTLAGDVLWLAKHYGGRLEIKSPR